MTAVAAPAMVTQTPSYVAPPAVASYVAPPAVASYVAPPAVAMPQAIVAPPAPVAPRTLTDGIPNPQQIAAQKAQYSAALDKQLADAIATVTKETEIEKQMVKFKADKDIAL